MTIMVAETATANGLWVAGGPGTVRGLDPAQPPYLGARGQFSSKHVGVANFVFGDCSVRAFRPSLSPKVFEAMATIAGGEKLGQLDDY